MIFNRFYKSFMNHVCYVYLRRRFCRGALSRIRVLSDESKVRLEVSKLLEFGSSWPEEECALREEMSGSMLVEENFVSEAEEESLLKEVDPYLRRLRYEYDHWDKVIHGFRETERNNWTEENNKIIGRVRERAFQPGDNALSHVHVLDLAAKGHIKPHVDAVRFCGSTIAGLCLLSDAVMRLNHSAKPHLTVDVLLPRRSLYIISGPARYDFSHEILEQSLSKFRNKDVPRDRRISIICRNEPRPTA